MSYQNGENDETILSEENIQIIKNNELESTQSDQPTQSDKSIKSEQSIESDQPTQSDKSIKSEQSTQSDQLVPCVQINIENFFSGIDIYCLDNTDANCLTQINEFNSNFPNSTVKLVRALPSNYIVPKHLKHKFNNLANESIVELLNGLNLIKHSAKSLYSVIIMKSSSIVFHQILNLTKLPNIDKNISCLKDIISQLPSDTDLLTFNDSTDYFIITNKAYEKISNYVQLTDPIELCQFVNKNVSDFNTYILNKLVKNNYKFNVIPLNVYQTWKTKKLPNGMLENLKFNQLINPEFNFIIYDDNDCINFIKSNFSIDVFYAFNKLIPGAYKADLWRYCILYIYGGIYMDIKFKCINNFKLINLVNSEYFPTDVTLKEYQNEPYKAVYNGFIISKPKNGKLLQAINQIVFNVNNNYYGLSPLDITGPVLFGSFFTNYEKQYSLLKRYVEKDGNGVAFNNLLILDEYKTYRNEQNNIGKHYHWHYFNKNVYNSSDIIFVTAFKDIGRNAWKTHIRTNDDYFNYFFNLANNINYKLIVYVDNEVKNELLIKYHFTDNVIFKNIDCVLTFYEKYLNEETEIINSNIFKSKVPTNRLGHHPETWNAKYNLINHSKINFVNYTKKIYPNYKFYSWIDFGYVRNLNSLPQNIDTNKISNGITYQSFEIPLKKFSETEILQINEATIAGSSFIVSNDFVEKFEQLYEQKLIKWHREFICDDDQSLVLQIYNDNNEIFNLIVEREWFSLFKHFI